MVDIINKLMDRQFEEDAIILNIIIIYFFFPRKDNDCGKYELNYYLQDLICCRH